MFYRLLRILKKDKKEPNLSIISTFSLTFHFFPKCLSISKAELCLLNKTFKDLKREKKEEFFVSKVLCFCVLGISKALPCLLNKTFKDLSEALGGSVRAFKYILI